MRHLFAYRFTWLVLLALALAIGAERVPAGRLAVAPLVALLVPPLLLLTALLALHWARRRRRIALLPLAALALAWGQVQRGLPLHPAGLYAQLTDYAHTPLAGGNGQWVSGNGLAAPLAGAEVPAADSATSPAPAISNPPPETRNQEPETRNQKPATLRLLSANVRVFDVYAHLRAQDPGAPARFIAWLAASPADVLCLQEFYQEPAGSRAAGRSDVFQTGDKLGPAAGRQAFISHTLTNWAGAEFGMAIFTRYPIVGRGEISFGRLSQNHAMWVDVAGPAPGDTVRIFNAHLQSMSLDEGDIVAAGSSRAGLESKGRGLLRRFVRGAAARAWQADTLAAHVARSPYPVLLAGDLNDLPYSYAYARLADYLQNAWATVGFGVGNTYHGRLPGLLRIDQQFAGPEWQVLACRIHDDIPYSDHYPVEAAYRLR